MNSMRDEKLIKEIAFALGVDAEVMNYDDLANMPLDEQARMLYGESELLPKQEADVKTA